MSHDADIDLILTDCGDSFTADGDTQPCLFSGHDEVAGGEQQFPGAVMPMAYVLIRTSAFPNLQRNDPVAVKRQEDAASTNYRVSEILRVQDGRITQVFLGKA